MAVQGGNWQIFDSMVASSGATVYKNTSVASLALVKSDDPDRAPRYSLSTKDASSVDDTAEDYPMIFDNVILATPWQYSDIKAGAGVIKHKIEEIPYMRLHVTLFTSPYSLQAGYFGLEPGSKAPRNVYTTLKEGEEPGKGPDGVGGSGFYSISTLRRVMNPETGKREYLYKIFSAEAVTSKFLTEILGAHIPETFTTSNTDADAQMVDPISWYHATAFNSYPLELPRVTFQDPVVGSGVYYTSGMESFISTMETSALMGMNVARLVADGIAEGLGKGNKEGEERVAMGEL